MMYLCKKRNVNSLIYSAFLLVYQMFTGYSIIPLTASPKKVFDKIKAGENIFESIESGIESIDNYFPQWDASKGQLTWPAFKKFMKSL